MNFAKLFGKKDAKKQPQGGDKAQLTAGMLNKKIKEQELKIENIEKKTSALQNEAKAKLKAGDKAGAKRILAKKKKYVEQIKQLEGAMAMMEEQKFMLENVSHTKDVVNAIKEGNAAVKEASKGMSVEDLDTIKGEMEDLKANQDELNDFFKEYGEQDQEGVDEELDELEKEMANEDVGAMPVSNKENLGPVPAEKDKEEADLNAFLA